MRAAVLSLALLATVRGLGCVDDNGNAVDWFAMFKYSGGAAYSYSDVNNETPVKSQYSVTDTSSGALANTLGPLFAKSFALYNDEPPTGTASSSYGHTKGVVGLDDDGQSGFWLVHSVPKFPSRSGSSYGPYPSSGLVNGQSFLCVSLTGDAFTKVAKSLRLTRPKVYDVVFSSTVASAQPDLNDACVNGAAYLPAASNITAISSAGGNSFTYYAKNALWGQDVYGDLVGPNLQVDLITQTWQDGVNPLPNYCTPTHTYSTKNIQSYTVNGVTVHNTQDHSKWALSGDGNTVCIGGINRMESQEKRPGGTFCFTSTAINNALSADATTYSTPPKGACA